MNKWKYLEEHYINKGFIVKDRQTGETFSEPDLLSTIGVSDGLISIG